MRRTQYTKAGFSLKRIVKYASEWIQAALMLLGAFAVFTYAKQRWPEVMNYTTEVASSAFTIFAIGFFLLYSMVRPFLEGFREARDPKLKLK